MVDLSTWSLRDKIGQIVMCGFDGTTPTEGIKQLIQDYKLGGIIYFRRNVGPSSEVARLSAELQALSSKVTDVPLWIAIDQEGGMVSRIDQDVALMPGNMAIGATGRLEYAYRTARVSADELLQMGINMNFAPCLDVNNNPANPVIGVRSFGENPEKVAELGAAAIEGYQESGVSACAKHFPGHGDTSADSHHELPVVRHDHDRLHAVELVPFRRAIEAGVDAIMTAHVMFPAYENSGVPSTLSNNIITGLLREELGYNGVIVTDCLEMKAISETVGIGKGAVMSLQAGVDLVLVSHRLDRQLEAFEAIHAAVASGELTEERIDQSVRRIVELKLRRGQAGSSVIGDDAAIGSETHLAVAREAAEHSVTLVRNENQAVPLQKGVPTFVIWPEVRTNTEVDEIIAQNVTIGSALRAYNGTVVEHVIGTEPTQEEIEQALQASAGYAQVVVGTYNASFSTGQTALVNGLLARDGVKVVVAALRNPYDLNQFPKVHGYLACYENRPIMMEALAKVLAGEARPLGKLPVTITEQYAYGHGLA
ncbi:beta-N-acetylhexosaminidase [Paenibacillus sp. PR3]|uniref:Beta-N-acetylhexosaminidase n=1 Tax=Paenibacillus terricola TaxID=2763503 RepID=A0ABR8N4G6_9BACL|nr:beta-N-acetylhexosaminidase [Paenibacillus terricola]MBD3921349.1 beta-N-acetylhexosaminidase [Paenibacillus terricola]